MSSSSEQRNEAIAPENADCNCSEQSNKTPSLTLPMAVMMVMNYVGAGFLLLPYGFSKAGPMLGTLTLALVCVQALLTSFFVLRSCQRVTWIAKMLQRMSRNDSRRDLNDHHDLTSSKLELSFLTRYFLGKKACWFFTITTCLDLYAISWTNASVFAQALADQWPIDGNTSFISDYQVYGLLFMVIAIPLSCSYLLDQLYFQLAFFGARIVMVIFMIITLIMAFANPEQTFFDDQPGGITEDPPALFQWSGFLTMVTLGVFSTAFQFSVPFISSSTELGKRGCSKRPSGIFFYAVLLIFGTNATLSLLISLYFGENTEASSNLNWNSYKHGDRFVGKFVVLFAALDGLAVYPLLSLSLGDILMHAFHSDCSEEEVQEMEKDWRKRLPFCLVASIPQAVASLFVSDLPTLAALGVIFTLLSYTACPSLLYLASGARVRGVLRMSKECGCVGKDSQQPEPTVSLEGTWIRNVLRMSKEYGSIGKDSQEEEPTMPMEDDLDESLCDDMVIVSCDDPTDQDDCYCSQIVPPSSPHTLDGEVLSTLTPSHDGSGEAGCSVFDLKNGTDIDDDPECAPHTTRTEVSPSASNLDWAAVVLLLTTGAIIIAIISAACMGSI